MTADIDASRREPTSSSTQYQQRHLPAHRSAVRRADGVPVDRRHRLRAVGVAARVGRHRQPHAPPRLGRGRRSAASSACSPRCSALFRPGLPSTRYTIAIAQMLMGALLIHLTGGRIETHFHVFGSLAFLAFYRDWRVLVPATSSSRWITCCAASSGRSRSTACWSPSQWRWVEHAAWVVFEDIFLVVSCRAQRRGDAADGGAHGGARAGGPHPAAGGERARRCTAAVGLALTRGTELRVDAAAVRRRARRSTSTAASPRIWTLDDAGEMLELQPTRGRRRRRRRRHARVPVGAGAIGAIARDRAAAA